MSSSIKRAKNYIRECDLPKKSSSAQGSSHGDHGNCNNRGTKDGKPTASELEEAQLLIGAAGSIGEEQLVFMMDGPEVNHEESTPDHGNDCAKTEISEEQLRKELQDLLDSQLNPEDDSDSASKHLMSRREQVFETEDEPGIDDISEPSKCFTEGEIQAFMNNQIRKLHQQRVLGEQFDKASNRSHPQPQQHLILVTQNGDKIILIQNPNEMERDESEQSDFQPSFDITEEEEQLIQVKHRERQGMLLLLLEKLREQHRQRLPAMVTTPAVPHLQPIKLVPFSKSKPETVPVASFPEKSDLGQEQSGPKSRKSTKGARKRPGGGPPKWLKPVNNYLSMAVKYMKRREEKVDEIAKMFPSASSSFEQKCQNMKQDLLKIELIIERFQNTIGNDFEEASTKFKSFLREFDLENYLDEVEAGDEVDEFDSNLFDVEDVDPKSKQKKTSKKTIVSTDMSSNIKLITPSNISIVTTSSNPSSTPQHTQLGKNQEADPFDFNQDPDSMIDIKPIIPNSPVIKTGLVSKHELLNSEHDRPVRSARLQNKRLAKDPINSQTPPKVVRR